MAALKLLGAAILAIYVVQVGLYSAGMIELGASMAAFAVVFGGVLLWARRRGYTRVQLGWRRPPAISVVAGVVIGVSAWYVNLWIVTQIQPPGDSSELERIVKQTPLFATLIGLAVLPALSEEMVFRGVFMRALATKFAPVHAIGFSATVFGLYHLLPAQMITAFCLGLVLGFVTWRAGSAIPAMIAHALNNTIALLISRDEVPGLAPWMEAHGGLMLAATSAVLASGLALAAMPRAPA